MAKAPKPNPQILKDDILKYLRSEGLAIFQAEPDTGPTERSIWWDTKGSPDYKEFVAAARAVGAKMILFFDEELEGEEIFEVEEALEAAELEPEHYREYARRIGELRSYVGFTSRVCIGFASDGYFYWYDLEAAWYEDFMDLLDELHLAGIGHGDPDDFDEDDDEDEVPPRGNFYSNN